jgi:excisionase family DNA binding protein
MLKKEVLTTGQVAQLCNVAPRTVTKWFDSGQLGGYRIPGSKDRRIPQSELIRFMKTHNIPTDKLKKGKLRILIIDSRTDYSQHLSERLQSKGSFEIQCAKNSFDAGLSALKFSPNIIIFDLMSNDIDSASLCEYIRQCEELTECKLIALAGGLSCNEKDALQKQGYDAVIIEPQNFDTILISIQESINIFG